MFYGISTIVGYLMPDPLYTYIYKIYDMVWFGFMAYCNILTFDLAVNQETGAPGRRYQYITLIVDGLNSVQSRRPQEAVGRQTMI